MAGAVDGVWSYRGKTYYTYGAYKKAVDAYTATVQKQAAAAKQATSSTTTPTAYKKPAAPKPPPPIAPQAPVGPSAYQLAAQKAAAAARLREQQLAWQKQQELMMQKRAAEQRAIAAQQAEARRQAALRARMNELREQRSAAAQQEAARVAAELKSSRVKARDAFVAQLRAESYGSLGVRSAAALKRVAMFNGRILESAKNPLNTLSGRQEAYANREQRRRADLIDFSTMRDDFNPSDRNFQNTIRNPVYRNNQRMIRQARESGDWTSILEELDRQSRSSGGRWHDEQLFNALQSEVVQPVIAIDTNANTLFAELNAAEEAGDTARIQELVNDPENRTLYQEYVEWFGDERTPGKAEPVFNTLTELARRRDRIWLATIGAGGESLAGMSEERINSLEQRAIDLSTVQRERPQLLAGEESLVPPARRVSAPMQYERTIRDAEGRPVNIIEYGVDAYLARERDREEQRYMDAYRQSQIDRHRMLEGGYEEVKDRNGNMIWRRADVGDALELTADVLGISDKSLMGRFDNIVAIANPAVQEVELRRFLDQIQDKFRADWERQNPSVFISPRPTGRSTSIVGNAGAGWGARTAYTQQSSDRLARRNAAIQAFMEKVVYGLTGVKGGGIGYDGRYLAPIEDMLPALQDPVNDVVNHWRDLVEPGVSRRADIYFTSDASGGPQIAFRNEIAGTAAEGRDFDPTIKAEYDRWLQNRDHPDGDVRSAANRRWRQITLTGNVSFVADVVLDPLNALGLLTRPLKAANLVRQTAAPARVAAPLSLGQAVARGSRVNPLTLWGRMNANVDRFGKYLTPQVQSPRQAGWTNTFNYHHVRRDRALVDAARELGIDTRQALNYSDGQWEEFYRVRNGGEDAIGATVIGRDLFQTKSVNRTQLMTVIQERLPDIMRRHGVTFADPAERARQVQRLMEAGEVVESATKAVADLEDSLVQNAAAIQALKRLRNTQGDRPRLEHIADLDQQIATLERNKKSIQAQITQAAKANAEASIAARRSTGMSDEAYMEMKRLDQREAALAGSNAPEARRLHDRISRLEDERKYALELGAPDEFVDAITARLQKARQKLEDLPGIESRREWHKIQRERRVLAETIQAERRAAGIYTHFNNPGRIKQMAGRLESRVNARVKSAWGTRAGLRNPFGRGLYLSGDDAVWSGFLTRRTRTVRQGGKGKMKGGGAMRSNKRGGAAAIREEIDYGKERLSRGFFRLNPGVRSRIKTIGSIAELRAAFREVGLKFDGKVEELGLLADKLREAGYAGIEITGLRAGRSRSRAWLKLRSELRGDQLVLFDPENAGSWIDTAAQGKIDLDPLRQVVADADEQIKLLKTKREVAHRSYVESKKAPTLKGEVDVPLSAVTTSAEQAKAAGRARQLAQTMTRRIRGVKGEKPRVVHINDAPRPYTDLVNDLSEVTQEYKALHTQAMADMEVVLKVDEILKSGDRAARRQLRQSQQRLKETLKAMDAYEDRMVFEATWPGGAKKPDRYPGENDIQFGIRQLQAKLTGKVEPQRFPWETKGQFARRVKRDGTNLERIPEGPAPKPVEKKGLITQRFEQLGNYHRAIGGSPVTPSFVDVNITKIREDRLWLRGMEADLERQIANARSVKQAEVLMRRLLEVQEAQRGLRIELNILDKGRGVARRYAVERLARVKPAVRPQRIAHLTLDETGRLFGASEDMNTRLRRVDSIVEGDPMLTPEVKAAVEKVIVDLKKIPANRIELRPGYSKPNRAVIQLENLVGQGELSLYDAYVTTLYMIKDPAFKATHTALNRQLAGRIIKLLEQAGVAENTLKPSLIARFVRVMHHGTPIPDNPYELFKRMDAIHAAELEKVRGYKAHGQVHVAASETKGPPRYRGVGSFDTDPMVLGAKLKIARETGVDMFLYDDLRAVFGDIMVRENRAKELAEKAVALAAKNGTEPIEEMRKLRELAAEEEAVRNFEEFATRPEFQGMPMERVLAVFEQRTINRQLSAVPPLRVTKVQDDLMRAGWREITGFDHADEAARAKWLQRQFGDITDPTWVKEVDDAKRLLAQNAADIEWNMAHAKEIDAVNARRVARAPAGSSGVTRAQIKAAMPDATKKEIDAAFADIPVAEKRVVKAKYNLRNLLTPTRVEELKRIANSPRRTIGGVADVGTSPPLHRRDLMREWFVKEGRWDPETGEAIRLGRRVWSVDEERGLYMDNFGYAPVWTDDDWLVITLRDQRAYQRAYRTVGFVDESFENLADGQVVDPITGEITLTGEVLRGKELKDAMAFGKKGFKAQRTLEELRQWAIGRYGARVAVGGKFHAMPWLMRMDDTEYFPWLRHALSAEGREEFRQTLESARPKMGQYFEEQYFDDAGGLRSLGMDIDPSMFGAKNADEAEKMMDRLGDALYNAVENRMKRIKRFAGGASEEWMSEEMVRFAYDIMENLMTDQRWRGFFRGRTPLQGLLHIAGWQRTFVSFNPAFGIMNLLETFGYKRGLLMAIHNNFVPMSLTAQKYRFLIPTLESIDDSVSRLFGIEGAGSFGARSRDRGLATGLRFRAGAEDLANWGAHASKWGEDKLRLDFARVMAGQAYESALHQGMGKGAATVVARMYAKRQLKIYFASIGDNPVMMAFNQVIPFFSYRLKQMTLAVSMAVQHPWIPLLLGKIQTAIIDLNRNTWIEEHGNDDGFDPTDPRTHSLWINVDGTFYGLDLWDISDWTRAMRQVVQTGTIGKPIVDAVRDFIRIPHPLQLGLYAMFTGTETPWGRPGHPREMFWFVDLALWATGKDYENPKWQRDALQMGTQMFFFAGLGKMTPVDQAIMTYYAMIESGDKEAAYAYMDKHPEIGEYFEMTKAWRKPRWDPYGGRSQSWYANLTDEARDEYDALYEDFNRLQKTLNEEVFRYASAPWSAEYRAAKQRRDLVIRQWHIENPELSRTWFLDVPYEKFAELQDDWLVSDQVDTWFYLLNQRPKREDFNSDLLYAAASVRFNEQKQAWLEAHPAVMDRLYESNNALVQAWHDQELQWSEILDFQARINERVIREEMKGAESDPDLIDALYQAKNFANAMLDGESYAFVHENVVPGSQALNRLTGIAMNIASYKSEMGRLKSAIKIPGFSDYRYGNASPEERVQMDIDTKYYNELGSLAEQMKKYRDEPFSDMNDWWGQLRKRGLLDRYLKENPDKKDDYNYVVAIGNIITNYGKNFWTGLMEPGNQWLLNEYLTRNPEKRAQYEFMRGLDMIWKTIGTDYTRFYSELAKIPWLEAEYFRRNPDKAGKGANSAYALAMGQLVNSATSGADFYAKLNANPWLRDEYFRRHPEKRAQMEANEAYIAALQPWIEALKRDDFVAAKAAWDAMPAWAKERYLAKNPDSGMADGMGSDAPGGGFRTPEARARFLRGQEYYAGIGGWVELLKAKDYVGAKEYFDALPIWIKEKYWAKRPDQRASMELDKDMLADGAAYFLATGSDKDKVLARNPGLYEWMQQHGGDEAKHRGLIIAMYRAIPSRDAWLKRTFREKFPEIFSQEAAGERRLKSLERKLAENPDIIPYYERALKLQQETYRNQLKLNKQPPRSWSMERAKRLRKRTKRRGASFSSHWARHQDQRP